MPQNRSSAVMQQRFSFAADDPDHFPTPCWATRALIEHVFVDPVREQACLEPACGAGDMARPLAEYFGHVAAYDAFDYGFAEIRDFLTWRWEQESFDWVITNPPFRLAQEFVESALPIARTGVAMLVRTAFIEGVGSYNGLFSHRRPTIMANSPSVCPW